VNIVRQFQYSTETTTSG